MVISSKEESVGSTRNESVKGRCSLNSRMSVCRVLRKLSNHVVDLGFFLVRDLTCHWAREQSQVTQFSFLVRVKSVV